MALKIGDRVQETFTTTGTGTVSLGGAVTGYQAFSAICSNSDTAFYAATDGTNWEVGLGTYTSAGNTLARTTILASSNSGSAVNWSAGTKNIWLDLPAKAVTTNFYQANNLSPAGTTSTASLVMAGLAGAITPARSGTIVLSITGVMANSANGDGVFAQLSYGTSTAPVNGAAQTGTQIGGGAQLTEAAANAAVPFAQTAVITGLTLGTAYWLDLSFQALTGGTATMSRVTISAFEL